jgi:RNA polymerase sigma factor (sigma-70 family)
MDTTAAVPVPKPFMPHPNFSDEVNRNIVQSEIEGGVYVDELCEGAVDERKSRVVELRYFGGLSVEETGEVLKVSPETVMRDWKLAKAWLLRELSGERGDES